MAVEIVKGTFEKFLPSYWSLCTLINQKSTNKTFGILLTIYLAAMGVLATLPSIDLKKVQHQEGKGVDFESQNEIINTLFDVLKHSGPELTTLHVALLVILGCTASLIGCITISVMMTRLCKVEDDYFKGHEGLWPFRSVSISPLPFFWWIYYEFSEKSLMILTIFQYWNSFSKIKRSDFQDYSHYAPIKNKWESLRFIAIFAFVTIVLGLSKIFFLRFTKFYSPEAPVKPFGLSKANEISEETWMKSAPAASQSTTSKAQKSSKSSQKLKKRK